ncbi:MAG TPA: ankyrin repeat domain-containing protein [Pyrinomonadaceae bacterium]|jgi:ankyrin repeat protein|nr:ankyrin repeat domain-containing protein [Pyrinomonadaceae bacterium]
MSQEFIEAATSGDVAKVKEMLSVDPLLAQSKDQNGLSVILKAVYYGRRDVVEALLASGVQLNIFEASATGQTDSVRTLLEADPALVNSYSPDGFAPLSLAVFFGHPETVDVLLAAGAEVNAASRETMKLTPLASAMATAQNEIARTLIDRGANVNAKGENDVTPLHTAAARGNIDAAILLLDHGADIDATTKDGKKPITYAEERNQPEMVEFLKNRV